MKLEFLRMNDNAADVHVQTDSHILYIHFFRVCIYKSTRVMSYGGNGGKDSMTITTIIIIMKKGLFFKKGTGDAH